MTVGLSLSIVELRKQYRCGEVTPEQVISEILRRAAQDTEMNIWITPPSLEDIRPSLNRLAHLDREAAPLWGIPFAVKDNFDVAGLPTTAGCPAYAYSPSEHAVVIQRLVDAGAILVGKTNMDQFATGLVGTRSPYGETHNAMRRELISGGSSSGSAVAVARGQAAFALGTDTAGSGRVPAALNGLVGFKPSLGVWSGKGVVPACASLDAVSVFANNLGDAILVDKVLRGRDDDDPWSRAAVTPLSIRSPARICLPGGPLLFFGPFGDAYKAAWEEAVQRFCALGIPVEFVAMDLFYEAASILYEGPWVAERWADLGDFIESHPGEVFPVTEQVLRSGCDGRYDAVAVFRALHQLQAFKMRVGKLLNDAVLVLPTTGGTWTREEVRQDPIGTNRDLGRYTNHCNLLDLCAVAIPAGEAGVDLPFGVTLFGLAAQEDLICGLAALFDGGLAREALDAVDAVDAVNAQVGGETVAGRDIADATLVAVCGLHMRGLSLEWQMQACGARFVREAVTAANYRLVRLATTPAKPGLIRCDDGGAAIAVELWDMALGAFGGFVASIPAPLGIGQVELDDGSQVPGFICESYAAATAEDITRYGGWRRATDQGVRERGNS